MPSFSVTALAGVFLNALFPLILLGGIGALADRWIGFDRKSLNQLNVYVLLPPLLFSTLMRVPVTGGEVFRVAIFTFLTLASMALLGSFWAFLHRADTATRSSAVLGATFFNGVNLGFPIAAFTFGDAGLQLASVLIAVNSIPHNGVGMFIAARGALSTRQTFSVMLRMPLFYAMALALILRLTEARVPEVVLYPIESLGRAAIPYTLVCIGMELARMRVGKVDRLLAGIVALRLLVAPLVAIAAADLVGLSGLLRAVVILQASMPSAIAPIVYARVFGGNVDFLSRAVFYSTLGSLVTLPFLLSYLQDG